MPKSSQAAAAGSASSVPLPAVAVPDPEVKVYLDVAKVLDVEFKPTRDVDKMLDLKESSRKMSMHFLDARPPQIHLEGWIVRILKFEGEEKFELSYNRRFPLGSGTLDDALAVAAKEGLHAQEDDYDAQLEWGFQKQTLSFTLKKEFKAKGYDGMNLPALADVRGAAVNGMPGKLDHARREGWARGVLEGGHLFGPVLGNAGPAAGKGRTCHSRSG